MDEQFFDMLEPGAKELISILAGGKSVEFEEQIIRESREELRDGDGIKKMDEDMREGYIRFLNTVVKLPKHFLAQIYSYGYRDGFCGCLRCMAMCKERDLDSLSALFESLRKEADKVDFDPAEKIDKLIDKLKQMRECMR